MDFTRFIPRDLHRVLAYFGKFNWVEYRLIEQGSNSIQIAVQAPKFDPKQLSLDEYHLGAQTAMTLEIDRIYLSWMYILSKCITKGPKIFYLNLEQAESLSQIDVEIGTEDFQQPYPTVIYHLPKEFSAQVQEQFGLPWRGTDVITHIDESGFILTGIMLDNDARIVFICPPHEKRLEEVLGTKMNNYAGDIIEDAEMKACRLLERVALNAAMLLMQYPVKKEPEDAKQWDKHNGKKKLDDRQKLFKLADMERLSFKQNIVIREVIQNTSGHGEFHRSPKSHWRRGHWRMQAYGSNSSLRKRILIKPVFVNSLNFVGDLSQTSVEMRKQ